VFYLFQNRQKYAEHLAGSKHNLRRENLKNVNFPCPACFWGFIISPFNKGVGEFKILSLSETAIRMGAFVVQIGRAHV
jgi:hypothetical protein